MSNINKNNILSNLYMNNKIITIDKLNGQTKKLKLLYGKYINPRLKKIWKEYIEIGVDPGFILPDGIKYVGNKFIRERISAPNINTTSGPKKYLNSFFKSWFSEQSEYRFTEDFFKDNKLCSSENYEAEDEFISVLFFKKLFKKFKGKKIDIFIKYSQPKAAAGGLLGLFGDALGAVQETDYAYISKLLRIPRVGYNSYFNGTIKYMFMVNSGDWIPFYSPIKEKDIIIKISDNGFDHTNLEQYFLDGKVDHCFFQPVLNWAENKKATVKSSSSKKKYNSIVNKCNKYLLEYKSGVPENKIESICSSLNIGIQIDLPDNIENYIDIRSTMNPLKVFKFVNTRINHIELNKVTTKQNYIEKSKDELLAIEEQLIADDIFYSFNKNKTKISTLDETFIYLSEYEKIVKDFEEKNKLDYYKLDITNNSELQIFLEASMKSNQTKDFKKTCSGNSLDYDISGIEANDTNHIDITKSHYTINENEYYNGFPYITDFRKCSKIESIGFYQIYDIEYNNRIFKKLEVLKENNVYFSQELNFYKDNGVKFKIKSGAFGTKFDITYTEDMKKKEYGLPHYCKWSGNIHNPSEYKSTFVKGDKAFYNIIRKNNQNVFYFEGDIIQLEYPRKKIYSNSHIKSCILSYERISIMTQLLTMEYKDIVRVCVDGIYYLNEYPINKRFTTKEQKTFSNFDSIYVEDQPYFNDDLPEERIFNELELHTGAGGAGKTHFNMMDKGLLNPLYIAPAWRLARSKSKTDSTCFFHILLSTTTKDEFRAKAEQLRYYNMYKNYNTFIIDEVSMLTNTDKEKILELWKGKRIIFCGDIKCQLPPVKGEDDIFKEDNIYTKEYSKNYRIQCPKLKKLLNNLRHNIINNTKPDIKELKIYDKNKIDYSVNDIIISKTNEEKDIYTDKYKHLKKYRVKSNTLEYSNGEIIIGEKPAVNCEIQHGFTIHSVQGETIQNPNKLFIDIRKISSVKMLYTALSRCRNINQIYLIK